MSFARIQVRTIWFLMIYVLAATSSTMTIYDQNLGGKVVTIKDLSYGEKMRYEIGVGMVETTSIVGGCTSIYQL